MADLVPQLNRALIIYTWGSVGVLLVLLYQIARFYQTTSGERSHYRWFLVPLVFFAAAAIRYAHLADFAGDPLGDGLLILAGGSLFLLGYHLLRLMLGGRS